MNISLRKIKFLLISIKDQIYFSFPKKNTTSESSNYIISLTSYYKRFNTLHLVIESLLQQSIPPKQIILWLSQQDIDKNNGIPKKITSLVSRGLIIKIKEENIKSYKKLSYISESIDSDVSHILTADDDIFYPHYWALDLITTSVDKECIACFRGHNFTILNDEYSYTKAMKNNLSEDVPSYNLIPTGCSGIAYPRDAISSMVASRSLFEHLCPDTDDIWYKMMTLKNGYRSCRVMRENIHFPVVLQSLGHSLFSVNVYDDKNSKNLKSTIEYFGCESSFK